MNRIFPTADEWRKATRYAVIVLVFAFVAMNYRSMLAALTPFLLAFLLSYVLEPAIRFLTERFRLGRGWASLIVLLSLILSAGGVILWATTVLVEEIVRFIDLLPQYRQTLLMYFDQIVDQATRAYLSLPPEVVRFATENASRLSEAAETIITALGRSALTVLTAIPALLTAGLLVLLATFFISKDLPQVKAFLWRLVPSEEQGRVRGVIGDLLRVAWRYLRAQAVLIMITTVLSTLGFLLIGINNWLSAGLMMGLMDLLPLVGPTLIYIPWIIYLIAVDNMTTALYLLIVFGVAVGTRSLVEAKVIGDSVGLHPALTLLAMYGGALLWGVKGVILGPVSFLVAKAIYKAWQNVEPPGRRV